MYSNLPTRSTEAVRKLYEERDAKAARRERWARTIMLVFGALMWLFILYVLLGSAYDWAKASGLL